MGENQSEERSEFQYSGVDPLQPASGPELVFGIVAPVGAERADLMSHLESELQEYGYQCERIKLSGLIELLGEYRGRDFGSMVEPTRTEALMDAGDSIREKSGLGDALAILAISEIRELREEQQKKIGKEAEDSPERYAYILDSLKHPDEISTLRAIYGHGFLQISGYSRRDHRVNNLAERIASSQSNSQGFERFKHDAERLISRDQDGDGKAFGQKVKKCFPESDFFVDLDGSNAEQKHDVERFLRVLFNDPFVTPSRDGMGMFHAEAASWRSSDLSRQVGSAICTSEGDVVALGCNEVPKPFGGLYWEGDVHDGRDFQLGKNAGNLQKRLIVAEIFDRLLEDDAFEPAVERLNELKKHVVQGRDDDTALEDLQALNVIEYGRTVHAEMAAISDAASRGVHVAGCTMYVNTFPCHICARHIVASGIKRLVYVEPYPKSLTARLFDDSIAVDPKSEVPEKVVFECFRGVAPKIFRFAFNAQAARKDEKGNPIRVKKSESSTKMNRYLTSYIAMERDVMLRLLPTIHKQNGVTA